MKLFKSYKEAHEKLKLKGSYQRGTIGNPLEGITSIKLTVNPKSFDRVSSDLKTILYVGIGKKSSQGEPAENQTREDQELFFTSYRNQNAFPVLIKLKANVVLYAGDYKIKAIHTKRSPQQLVFYHIELIKTMSK